MLGWRRLNPMSVTVGERSAPALDHHLIPRPYCSRAAAPEPLLTTIVDRHRPPEEGRMLLYEYKLRLSRIQQVAMEGAIRTTQSIRNKARHLWMDARGVRANDLLLLCARLAHDYPIA